MSKKTTIDTISAEKLIVIVRGVEKEKLIPLCEAMYDGGVRLVEITFDMKGSVTPEQTSENIRMLTDAFEGRMLIGAGTVVTVEQAKAAYRGGAKYLISPNTDERIIRFANENNIVSIPGALTPTEIVNAYNYGADFVKVFPSDSLGLGYIKAVRAPLSHIPMLCVGGVNENNVADFLKTGISGVGVGSNIVKKSMIDSGDYASITKLAKVYCDAIKG